MKAIDTIEPRELGDSSDTVCKIGDLCEDARLGNAFAITVRVQ